MDEIISIVGIKIPSHIPSDRTAKMKDTVMECTAITTERYTGSVSTIVLTSYFSY